MVNMNGALHLWPGGIPSSVRIQPERDMPKDRVQEESKAWFLFVSENWITAKDAGVDGDPAHYIVQQRRELIVRWAEADQSFRDSYHARASPPPSPLDGSPYPIEATDDPNHIANFAIVVLPPVDSSHAINHDHWIKFLLLFNRFDGAHENWMVDDDPSHGLVFAGESSAPPVDKQNALRWLRLENASFSSVYMTRSGMVLFNEITYFFMLDQNNLDEGTISVVTYARNGEVKHEVRPRAYFLKYLLAALGDSEPLSRLPVGGFDVRKRPKGSFDINAPVLSMLEGAKEEAPTAFDSSRFAENVEFYAPGYLYMEAQGLIAEYDPVHLMEEFDEVYHFN